MENVVNLAVLAVLLLAGPPQAADPCTLGPRMEGMLRFRGDSWQIRMYIDRPATDSSVAIDIPDLVMADQRIAARCAGDSLHVALPFGFGPVSLGRTMSGGIVGMAIVAGDTLGLELAGGEAPPYRVTPVKFRNGAVTLAGSAYVPTAPGPHPAIVLVQGSGPIGRRSWAYRSWADFFARLGFVALVYDKRGVGESTGDYMADSAFAGLAGDAVAAVEMLRSHGDVDPKRIGLVGHSQAGWIAYRAADSTAIAFLVLMAAPSVSVADQEFHRMEYGMRGDGFSTAAIDSATAHMRLFFYTAETGRGWPALRESSDLLRSTAWAEWLQLPDSVGGLRWWRTHASVDPTESILEGDAPILALYSRADPLVPAVENAGRLRELLVTGHVDSEVLSLPAGDHRLELPAGRAGDGVWRLPRIHPDALERMRSWLQRRIDGPPPT